MTAEHTEHRQPRISNEVLDERVTNYFERMMAEIHSMRAEIGKLFDRLARGEERIRDHEAQPGHAISLERLGQLQQQVAVNTKDIEQLKRLNEIEKTAIALSSDVAVLKDDMLKMKQAHDRETGVEEGRTQTFSGADRLLVRTAIFISALSTLLVIAERLS